MSLTCDCCRASSAVYSVRDKGIAASRRERSYNITACCFQLRGKSPEATGNGPDTATPRSRRKRHGLSNGFAPYPLDHPTSTLHHVSKDVDVRTGHDRAAFAYCETPTAQHGAIFVHSSIERPSTVTIPSAYHSMLAGAGAGLVSSVVTCPLDVVKTRLQAQVKSKGAEGYEGARETCIKIWRSGGIRGLYRGLGPTVLGYLPTWGIYFSVYDEVKSLLINRAETTDKNHWGIHIIAAMVAGASGTVVTNPLWLIRTRFMNQAATADGQERYTSTWKAFRSIYNTEGWRAFYKGLAPSLIGVTHVAVHFPLYEKMKIWAAPEDGSPLNSQRILLCSAGSKMVASIITYPHEVLRTRLQIQKRKLQVVGTSTQTHPYSSSPAITPQDGLLSTARNIFKQDGWKGFYRGISINLVRTVPSSAVTMLTYELIMRRLTSEAPR